MCLLLSRMLNIWENKHVLTHIKIRNQYYRLENCLIIYFYINSSLMKYTEWESLHFIVFNENPKSKNNDYDYNC